VLIQNKCLALKNRKILLGQTMWEKMTGEKGREKDRYSLTVLAPFEGRVEERTDRKQIRSRVGGNGRKMGHNSTAIDGVSRIGEREGSIVNRHLQRRSG